MSRTHDRVSLLTTHFIYGSITPLFYELTLAGTELRLFFACYGKFLRTLLANRTHRPPAATVVVVEPSYAVRMEVHVIGVVAEERLNRTRPIVAETAHIAGTAVVAIARSRKKYGITVYFTCYFVSVYSVLCDPCPSAVICIS